LNKSYFLLSRVLLLLGTEIFCTLLLADCFLLTDKRSDYESFTTPTIGFLLLTCELPVISFESFGHSDNISNT